MNFLYSIVMVFVISNHSGDKIEYLNSGDLKIVQFGTDNRTIDFESCLNEKELISAFGKPTSQEIKEEEAAGGKISMLYYDQNYFYFGEGKNSNKGFKFVNDQYHIIIRDGLKVKIGKSAEFLVSKVAAKCHQKNVYVGKSRFNLKIINRIVIPYLVKGKDVASHTIVSVVYNPEDYTVLEISQFNIN